MDNSEWCPHDEQLLTLLAKVRDEEEASMGTYTDNAFYKNFAARLSADVDVRISDDDVADRVRHHRTVYKSYKANPARFQHTYIGSSEYGQLLRRCFGIEKKRIRVPRNLGSRRSCSFDSTSSVARTAAPVATDPKITLEDELARVLSHLHSQHGLDANRLTLFSSFCEQNRLVSRVFLNLEGHAERLNFINNLDLSGYTRKTIDFIKSGGRTTAYVPELQKLTGDQAVKPQKKSSNKNNDEAESEGEEIAKSKGGKKTQSRAKKASAKRKPDTSDDNDDDDDEKKPATKKKSKGGNKKSTARKKSKESESNDDDVDDNGDEDEVKGKEEVANKVQTGRPIRKRTK